MVNSGLGLSFQELGETLRYFIYICNSTASDITLGFLYGYKALLQVIAFLLTFSIHNVKIKGLNDAKYITVAIYITSIVTAVIIVSTYSLKDFINVYASVVSGGFFVGTTMILILVFVPKVVCLIMYTILVSLMLYYLIVHV